MGSGVVSVANLEEFDAQISYGGVSCDTIYASVCAIFPGTWRRTGFTPPPIITIPTVVVGLFLVL